MDEDYENEVKKKLPLILPIFYGWVIVVVSALTMFFSGPGQSYSVSVFVDSYIEEFGWSRTMVSGIYSTGTLIAGLLMGVVGGIFDRLGHRTATTAVAIIFSIACFWMSQVESILMLFIGFFLIRLLGQGSLSLSSSTLVPQWFITKRGLAQSLASLGGVLMSIIFPPLNIWLIKGYGWRTSWNVWAVLLCAIMAPTAFIFIRNRPEEVGLLPDNANTDYTGTETEIYSKEESWTVRETLKTRSFWLLLFPTVVISAVETGIVFHFISIMDLRGISPETAALIFSITAMIQLPGGFGAGWIADRVHSRYLLIFSMTTYSIAIFFLLLTNSVSFAIAYGVIRGIVMGSMGILNGVLWPQYFGRRYLGSIRGITMMASVIGSALGPLPFGYAFDLLGGYQEVLIASIAIQSLTILCGIFAKPMKKS